MDPPADTSGAAGAPTPHDADRSAPERCREPAELIGTLIEALFPASTPARSQPALRQLRLLNTTLAATEWFMQTGRLPDPKDWTDEPGWPAPDEVEEEFGGWEQMLETAGLADAEMATTIGRISPTVIALRDRLVEDARDVRRREQALQQELASAREELERRLADARRQLDAQAAEADASVAAAEEARRAVEDELDVVHGELRTEREDASRLKGRVAEAESESREARERSLVFAARVASEFIEAPLAFRAWIELVPATLSQRLQAAAAALPVSLRHDVASSPLGFSAHFDGEQLVTVRRHESTGAAFIEITVVAASPIGPSAIENLSTVLWQHGQTHGALVELRALGARPHVDLERLRAVAHALTQVSTPRPDAGWPLHTVHSTVAAGDVENFAAFLCSPQRQRPVLALTSRRGRPPATDPAELAGALCGAAHVVVLTGGAPTKMTKRFGEDLGIFDGAVRVYQPGLAVGASGEEHPYLTEAVLSELAPDERDEHLLALIDPRLAVPTSLIGAADAARAPAAAVPCLYEAATPTRPREHGAAAQLAGLRRELAHAHQALRTFEHIVGEVDEQPPKNVGEAAVRAAREAKHLRFAPAAFTSAAESPFHRPTEVYAALRLLDQLAGEFEQGEIGERLSERAAKVGLDYRSAVSNTSRRNDAYTLTFEGQQLSLGPHLAIGGGGGPTRTLRVYLHRADGADGLPRGLIVGHIGVHLPAKHGG